MGRQYYEGTMPRIARALEAVVGELKQITAMLRTAREDGMLKEDDREQG